MITDLTSDDLMLSIPPNDSRVALSMDRRSILISRTAFVAGLISYTVTTSTAHTPTIAVTARAPASIDLVVFGDSIKEAEVNAGTSTAQRQTGLYMNYAGTGEIVTSLAQTGWPLQFDNYNDAIGSQRGILNNTLKYYQGGDFAQGGAQIADVSTQMELAKSRGFKPKCIIIQGGTNNAQPWTRMTQAAHLALIDKAIANWPTAIIGVENIHATSSTGAGAQNGRTPENIQASNAMIAQNVAARSSAGGGVSLIDVYTSYANRGTGRSGQTADFQDGLHPSVKGVSGAGTPVYRSFFASKFSGSSDKSEAHKVASVLPDQAQQVFFTGKPYTVQIEAGTVKLNDGTITGSMPTGMSINKVGSVRSNIITSIVDRDDGTRAIRVSVSKIATNTTETFRIYDTGINAHVSNSLAGKWFENVATIADDRNAGWIKATLSWLERSNPGGNTVNATYGLALDSAVAVTAGHAPLTAKSGARITKMLSPPKMGATTSTGSQRQLTIQFDPSAGDTMTIDLQLMDIRTRTAPQGAT